MDVSNSTDPVCARCGVFGNVRFRHCSRCKKVVCVDCLNGFICHTCKFQIESQSRRNIELEKEKEKLKKARKRKNRRIRRPFLIGFLNLLCYNGWKNYGDTSFGFIMFPLLAFAWLMLIVTLLLLPFDY